jgi:hypothetical protein
LKQVKNLITSTSQHEEDQHHKPVKLHNQKVNTLTKLASSMITLSVSSVLSQEETDEHKVSVL